MPNDNTLPTLNGQPYIQCRICEWYAYITPSEFFVYMPDGTEVATCSNHLTSFRGKFNYYRPINIHDINRYNTPPTLTIRSTD